MTVAQINDLITKLNKEADRRGYPNKIPTVSQYSQLSYDTIKAINDNRIAISKLYHVAERDGITRCKERSDKTGTPASWDGRDLSKVHINTGEDMLVRGGRPHSSQYNTLLSDIEKLNAMCACNSYAIEDNSWFVPCFDNYSCPSDYFCCQSIIVDDCPRMDKEVLNPENCYYVSIPCPSDRTSCPSNQYSTCYFNNVYGSCVPQCGANYETQYCGTNCGCNINFECECEQEWNNPSCGAQPVEKCICNTECPYNLVCVEFPK